MSGFRRFDPEQWEPLAEAEGAAKPAKAANPAATPPPASTAPAPAVTPTLATLATLATLPGTIAAGLRSLDPAKVPDGVKAEAWAEVVGDALALAERGWANQALSLGWSPLDLFGGVIDPEGDPHGDGLAVWLSSRRLVALSACCAACVDARGVRHYFTLPRGKGARLLWALSRGR